MRCVNCFFENVTGAQWCKMCGATLQDDQGPAQADRFALEARQERRGFFAFRSFIGPTFIQLVYVLGALAISLAGLLMVLLVLSGRAPEYTDVSRDMLLFGGLTLLGVGNILWRVLCEIAMLFFRMHEALTNVDDKARVLIALLAARK
jgi:hypothetical protein